VPDEEHLLGVGHAVRGEAYDWIGLDKQGDQEEAIPEQETQDEQKQGHLIPRILWIGREGKRKMSTMESIQNGRKAIFPRFRRIVTS
jgi:hypothetical protein